MRKLILTALFIVFCAVSVYAENTDTVYTITRGQLMKSLEATKSDLSAFALELEGFKGRSLNEQNLQNITEKQDALNTRVRSYYVIYDYIQDMPDDFRRIHNQAITLNGQNSGRINELMKSGSGTNTQGGISSWMITMVKNILLAQFPYLESILNLLLK